MLGEFLTMACMVGAYACGCLAMAGEQTNNKTAKRFAVGFFAVFCLLMLEVQRVW